MLGSKAPNYDTYELFRATHSHNSTQYSHIVGLSSHFFDPILQYPDLGHIELTNYRYSFDPILQCPDLSHIELTNYRYSFDPILQCPDLGHIELAIYCFSFDSII